MTLDDARDAFEDDSCDRTTLTYLLIALEYYQDGIISEVTMKHIGAECREYLEQLA